MWALSSLSLSLSAKDKLLKELGRWRTWSVSSYGPTSSSFYSISFHIHKIFSLKCYYVRHTHTLLKYIRCIIFFHFPRMEFFPNRIICFFLCRFATTAAADDVHDHAFLAGGVLQCLFFPYCTFTTKHVIKSVWSVCWVEYAPILLRNFIFRHHFS